MKNIFVILLMISTTPIYPMDCVTKKQRTHGRNITLVDSKKRPPRHFTDRDNPTQINRINRFQDRFRSFISQKIDTLKQRYKNL